MSSVTVAELRYGADRSQRREENHERLDTLLAELECVPFDAAAAREFGRIRSGLEAAGTPIGPYDTQIAAHAVALGVILVTAGAEEFRRVEGLRVENWRE